MNNPFDFFDRIYCISMDKNSFRWKMAVKQLKLLGIYDRTERIQGIKRDNYWEGCALSHQLCVVVTPVALVVVSPPVIAFHALEIPPVRV